RQEKGLSIRDVSRETNMSSSNLVAIEHENYTDLPADTFIRGQIAIYGDLLNLDGVETAKIFLQERDHQLVEKRKNRFGREDSSMSAKKLAEPAHISSATLAGGLLVIIILFTAGFCLYTGWNPFAYFLHQGEVQHSESNPDKNIVKKTKSNAGYIAPITDKNVQEEEAEAASVEE
ncbi:MAG: hypothetical protein D3923_15255, partial [Candidatus Electrothrix sp. AR3]|nr:hypothetical protein [Candidatus Electrothrix sp. AR3]